MVQTFEVFEEFLIYAAFRNDQYGRPANVQLGLYNSSDSLTSSNDMDDITTEPTDGNYTRQLVSLDSADINIEQLSGNWRATFAAKEFDVVGTTGSVDRAFAAVSFSSTSSSTSSGDHLVITWPLSQTYNLADWDYITVEEEGVEVSF